MVPNLVFCLIPAFLVLIGIRKLRERSWGYCKNRVQFDNKVVIITGANSGIGYEVAKELALRNAVVVLACRNISLAKNAIERIEQQLKKNIKMVNMGILNLMLQFIVATLASNLKKEHTVEC